MAGIEFDRSSKDFGRMVEMIQELTGDNPRLGKDKSGQRTNLSPWDIEPETLLDNMARIAYHETGRTLDPSQMQGKGGPGRGLFQYETEHSGTQQGAHTAVNRLTDWYDDRGWGKPIFLSKLGQDFDVSSLTESQQYQLFLADKAQDKTASFNENMDLKQFWMDEHLVDPNAVKSGKDKIFEGNMSSFDKKFSNQGFYKDTLLDQIVPQTP